jgi:DNA-binding IscR family transcriptional regulator
MISLHPQSNAAIAIVSRLCESHARHEETQIAELLKVSGVDEQMTWAVLAELVRAELVVEGFDAGGYLITREPPSIGLLDVITPFEPLLQNDAARIARAMRPMVLEHFRSITFAACATSCPSEAKPGDVAEEPANCPRSILAAATDQGVSAD